MLKVVALACIILAASAVTTTENLESYTFEQYVEEYEKSYELGSDLYSSRAKTFYENKNFIIEQNAVNTDIVLGINEHADLTNEEFSSFYLGHKKKFREQTASSFLEDKVTDYPKTVDFRTKAGVLTAVKNQGSCGSCWAFSATESMESATAIATGKDAPVLSPQEIVDCSPNPQHCGGTGGCQGSVEQLAFEYAIQKGMASNTAYPYKGRNQDCKAFTAVTQYSSYVNVTSNSRNALLEALQKQPVSVSVAAGSLFWQLYSSGIYHRCSVNADIDHAVQAVGYDMTDPENAYWIVRNSWGKSWGQSGYIYLKMYPDQPEDQSNCGVDKKPADGSGCEGGPSSVPVCGQCGILYDNSYPVV